MSVHISIANLHQHQTNKKQLVWLCRMPWMPKCPKIESPVENQTESIWKYLKVRLYSGAKAKLCIFSSTQRSLKTLVFALRNNQSPWLFLQLSSTFYNFPIFPIFPWCFLFSSFSSISLWSWRSPWCRSHNPQPTSTKINGHSCHMLPFSRSTHGKTPSFVIFCHPMLSNFAVHIPSSHLF